MAFVTAYPGALHAIDASVPSALRRLATFDTRGEAYDVAVAGGHVYVAGSAGLVVFRIGDWPEPTPTPAPPKGTTLYLPASTRNGGLGAAATTSAWPALGQP